MIFTDFQYLEQRICFNKISVPFTSPLSGTVGHEHIRFQGEGHRSIADRRLHMFEGSVRALLCAASSYDLLMHHLVKTMDDNSIKTYFTILITILISISSSYAKFDHHCNVQYDEKNGFQQKANTPVLIRFTIPNKFMDNQKSLAVKVEDNSNENKELLCSLIAIREMSWEECGAADLNKLMDISELKKR